MPKAAASKKSSWSSSLSGMLGGKSFSRSKKSKCSSDSSPPALLSTSCVGQGKRHFAQFKDALQTKEEDDTPRCSSVVSCSYGGSIEARSPVASSTARRSISTSSNASCSSPASNVIARLMGLEELQASPRSRKPPGSPSTQRHQQLQQQMQMQIQQERQQQQQIDKQEQQAWIPSPRRRMAGPQQLDSTQCVAGHTPQEFLDEMEDHLRQCDRALERIEAVMQLKKRLLYMSRQEDAYGAEDMVMPFYGYKSPSRDFHARGKDMLSPRHVRAQSTDYQLLLRPREQSFDARGYYYYCSDIGAGLGSARTSNLLCPAPSRGGDYGQQQQNARSRHRRSNSDGGGTPIFSPPPRRTNVVASSLYSPLAGSRRHMTVEQACKLSRSTLGDARQAEQAKQDEQQPSPVSVLDNNMDISPGSSSEASYEDLGWPKKSRLEEGKSNVVRALWRAAAAPDIGYEEQPAAAAATKEASVIRDIELLTWSDHRSEVETVAVVLECMIFKRLVEDTIATLI